MRVQCTHSGGYDEGDHSGRLRPARPAEARRDRQARHRRQRGARPGTGGCGQPGGLGDHQRPALRCPPGLRAAETEDPGSGHRRGGLRRGRRRERDPLHAGRGGVRMGPRLVRRIRGHDRGHAGAQTRPPHLRAGGGRARVRPGRPAGASRPRQCPGRAASPDQRSLRGHRQPRGADREVARRRGDRRHQHAERGARPIARRRSRDRLHPGGLHPERRAVRRHSGQRGEPLALEPAAGAHPGGDAGPQRRALRESLVRGRGPRRPREAALAVREARAAAVPALPEARGPGGPEGAPRGRRRHTGHRPRLSAERDPAGDRARGHGPCSGKVAIAA